VYGLILILSFLVIQPCFALSPQLKQKYDTPDSIKQEFTNVYQNLSNMTFKVVNSSPVVVSTGIQTIGNGQIIIMSTGTYAALYFRVQNLLWYQEFKLKQ
jgi:hypothetical protein